MTGLPLEGTRVLDLTMWWSGPYATVMLADMGAEVIEIESIQHIDGYRLYSMLEPGNIERSALHNWLAHSKYNITLDLTQRRGVEIFKQLARIADVVVENFSARVMENFGLGYSVLRQANPELIMLSMPAFGMTGPWRDYVGFAFNIEEMSGVTELTGYPDGIPMLTGTSFSDPVAGLNGAFAVLLALYHRRTTGQGQFIDLSQTESLTCLIGEAIADYSMNQRVQTRRGNRHPCMAPHGCYRCRGAEKWVAISVASDEQWSRLCQALGSPSWMAVDRFSSGPGRWVDQDELDRCVEEWTIQHDRDEVVALLQRAGIASGPVNTIEEVFGDRHLRQRRFFEMVERADLGDHAHAVMPPRLSKTPARIRGPAAFLGQHNDYVFGELLGMSQEERARLAEEKLTGTAPLAKIIPTVT